MLLALVPIVPVNAALNTVTVTNEYGVALTLADVVYYDQIVVVSGTGATPGRDINVYWDSITNWDGETGLLNSTKAEGNGAWLVWLSVPEAVNGTHWISVENVKTGETDTWASPIYVAPKIEVSPSSGLKGETVTISGYGYGDEVEVDDIKFNGVALNTAPTIPESNSLGSWSATFSVPNLGYADYDIVATDEDLLTNTTSFEIGAAITLSKKAGPSGTVVRITGRGFTAEAGISNGTITLNGIDCYIITDNVEVRNNADTTFTVDVVIPNVIDGKHTLEVTEDGAGVDRSATAKFTLEGNAGIEVIPEYGPVGSTVTVKGYNFTQISGETVVLELNGIGDTEVETNLKGEFVATFRVPGASGTVNFTATQADYGIDCGTNFRVGFITVVINPEEGPAGTEVSVSGSGFDIAENWNATIDGEEWIADTPVGAGGVITSTTNVPSLDAGVYDVVITESTSGISIVVEYTVTENTYVKTSPIVSPAGYNVTIEGYNFAENPVDATLTFVMYNETNEWDLDVTYGGVAVVLEADADWDDGYFIGYFEVPGEDDISIGSYTVNVTDGEDLFTQYIFNVVDKLVDIEPKKSVFIVGDTLGFNVESSFAQDDSYIKIWTPAGNLYWETDPFIAETWLKVGTIERVPYYEQVAGGNPMTFLEDTPLGVWDWIWYDQDDDELDTGVFTVEAATADLIGGQVTDLANQISDLADQLSDVTGEFDDVQSSIAAVSALARDAVAAANAATAAVNSVAATANTASEAASAAADAANAARDAASGLTTLVYGAIGAALVAALAAIVSLMQISRRIAG